LTVSAVPGEPLSVTRIWMYLPVCESVRRLNVNATAAGMGTHQASVGWVR
jgi:hypothetical protein